MSVFDQQRSLHTLAQTVGFIIIIVIVIIIVVTVLFI